jgi:hypothetical protein
MITLTKTFVESTWWRRRASDDATAWEQLPDHDRQGESLDQQISAWVFETGNCIVNPGQLGIHAVWHDDARQIKQVILGLTVLYQINDRVSRERYAHGPDRSGPEARGGANADGAAGRQIGQAPCDRAPPIATIAPSPVNISDAPAGGTGGDDARPPEQPAAPPRRSPAILVADLYGITDDAGGTDHDNP